MANGSLISAVLMSLPQPEPIAHSLSFVLADEIAPNVVHV